MFKLVVIDKINPDWNDKAHFAITLPRPKDDTLCSNQQQNILRVCCSLYFDPVIQLSLDSLPNITLLNMFRVQRCRHQHKGAWWCQVVTFGLLATLRDARLAALTLFFSVRRIDRKSVVAKCWQLILSSFWDAHSLTSTVRWNLAFMTRGFTPNNAATCPMRAIPVKFARCCQSGARTGYQKHKTPVKGNRKISWLQSTEKIWQIVHASGPQTQQLLLIPQKHGWCRFGTI